MTNATLSFYRPHDRSATWETFETVDPETGEVIKQQPSMTKQEFKDQCDINNIVKAFKITGQVQHISANAAKGRYEDLPDEVDFQTSLNVIREAEGAFASLPAKVRDRFNNDPAKFLGFLSDPANQDEAIKLGLATAKPDPAPEPPPAPPPAPEPPK